MPGEQIFHMQRQKALLDQRFALIRAMREWFWATQYIEIDAPLLVALPGQEPYLEAVSLMIHNEQKRDFYAYLHTSPEYAMKKALAAGYEKIFFLGKCFRDYESFSGHHQTEFTLCEWYRTESDMWDLMDEIDDLIACLEKQLNKEDFLEVQRLSMNDVWLRFVNISLDNYLSVESMRALCVKRGYAVHEDEAYEDLFYRIFLNEIEPKLTTLGAVMIYHYPAQMAALARISEEDSRYAERFELYINGIEIANAFSELTDAEEQRRRFEEEQAQRKKLGKSIIPIDEDFLAAVDQMPRSAGIALGVDRLIMALLAVEKIENIMPFPQKLLFDGEKTRNK